MEDGWALARLYCWQMLSFQKGAQFHTTSFTPAIREDRSTGGEREGEHERALARGTRLPPVWIAEAAALGRPGRKSGRASERASSEDRSRPMAQPPSLPPFTSTFSPADNYLSHARRRPLRPRPSSAVAASTATATIACAAELVGEGEILQLWRERGRRTRTNDRRRRMDERERGRERERESGEAARRCCCTLPLSLAPRYARE